MAEKRTFKVLSVRTVDMDQLPELLRPRVVLAELLRPSGRRRDGTFAAQHRGRAHLGVDTDEEIYDSTAAWRDRAMSGVLHSGTLVRDGRSEERTRL